MTDRRIPVGAIAAGLFCVVLVYLALQMREGNDPAIAQGVPAAQPRQVIVRRVIVRRIVGGEAGAAPARTVAPAVPAAAAPAPAPAPVVTRAS